MRLGLHRLPGPQARIAQLGRELAKMGGVAQGVGQLPGAGRPAAPARIDLHGVLVAVAVLGMFRGRPFEQAQCFVPAAEAPEKLSAGEGDGPALGEPF